MGRPRTLFVQAGERIGRGVVLDPEIRVQVTTAVPSGRPGARLRCDCGREYEAAVLCLVERKGRINTTSCGCAQREAASATGRRTVEQARAGWAASRGQSGLVKERRRDYQRWSNMMARCYNESHPRYPDWGGRGIRVCERWHDFRLFLEDIDREIGSCPPGLTLDRTDNDGDYGPGKVRWATYSQQNRNQRKKRGTVSRYRGVSWDRTRSQWQARMGVDGRTLMLGRFSTEEEAAQAYQRAVRALEREGVLQ